MSEPIKINPNLMNEVKKYGAFDVSACFNCGTCTATCPLIEAENGNEFPRGVIRLAQLGQKDKLLGSNELWMCYHCGDCTAACPREADPAGFMQASRKYAISEYEPTGLAKLFHKNRGIALFFMLTIGILFAAFMEYSNSSGLFGEHDYLVLGGYYGEVIHYSGMAMGIFVFLVLTIGFIRMYRSLVRNEPLRKREYIMDHLKMKHSIILAIRSFLDLFKNEILMQKRFKRVDEEVYYEEGSPPAYLEINKSFEPGQKVSRWMIHMSIFFGFIGLALATAFDYLIKDLILEDPAGWVPIYHPVRLLGIIAGISMLFGTTMSLYYRLTKPEDNEYYKSTKFDDWLLLILIWLIGLTGFFATIMVYLPTLPNWSGYVIIAHVVVIGELFLMIPFTKFAHMIYRPLGLWMLKYEELKIDFLENLPSEERSEVIKVIV